MASYTIYYKERDLDEKPDYIIEGIGSTRLVAHIFQKSEHFNIYWFIIQTLPTRNPFN